MNYEIVYYAPREEKAWTVSIARINGKHEMWAANSPPVERILFFLTAGMWSTIFMNLSHII